MGDKGGEIGDPTVGSPPFLCRDKLGGDEGVFKILTGPSIGMGRGRDEIAGDSTLLVVEFLSPSGENVSEVGLPHETWLAPKVEESFEWVESRD